MDKVQKLELMDKMQRELKDLEQSQTAVLKKVSQIAAHNITLSVELLDQKLPDLQETMDSNVVAIAAISAPLMVRLVGRQPHSRSCSLSGRA